MIPLFQPSRLSPSALERFALWHPLQLVVRLQRSRKGEAQGHGQRYVDVQGAKHKLKEKEKQDKREAILSQKSEREQSHSATNNHKVNHEAPKEAPKA